MTYREAETLQLADISATYVHEYMTYREAETLQLAGYRASFVDSEILTARTCFIHVHQERMIKRDVARREGSVCARGRRSYAYKYACDA